jgi:hypothetical protein
MGKKVKQQLKRLELPNRCPNCRKKGGLKLIDKFTKVLFFNCEKCVSHMCMNYDETCEIWRDEAPATDPDDIGFWEPLNKKRKSFVFR